MFDFTEAEYKVLERTVSHYKRFIDQFISSSTEEDRKELWDHVPLDREPIGITLEKLKVFLHLFQRKQRIEADDVKNILAYMKHTVAKCGWHDGHYSMDNDCLRCKGSVDPGEPQSVEDSFNEIRRIFFSKDYGKITLYIFSYCLTALFTSVLRSEKIHIPFLQVACPRGSVIYNLIQEIVEICDVNSGLIAHCTQNVRHCGYNSLPFHPTHNFDVDLESLVQYNDIPIIVDGTTNDKQSFYDSWLREIALIHRTRKHIELQNQFNILPIFVTPKIKLSYRGVMNMDLTDLPENENHLDLIRRNKKTLASMVCHVITNYNVVFTGDEKHLFVPGIKEDTRLILSRNDEIHPNDAQTIAVLKCFFRELMFAFQPLLPERGEYTVNNEKGTLNKSEQIGVLLSTAELNLTETLKLYSPATYHSASVTVTDETSELGSREADENRERVAKIAEVICKSYYDLDNKVSIRIPHVTIKKERYIFEVRLSSGVSPKKISKYARDVQYQSGLAYFMIEERPLSVNIVAHEKRPEGNSLVYILESSIFADRKMKIPYAIGYDLFGAIQVVDLALFPHLLIGGASNSGKSSALVSLLTSIAYRHRTGDVNVLIFDLGRSKLSAFSGHPILSHPIIRDVDTAFNAILALKNEMDERFKILRKDELNDEHKLDERPSIVCIIDEFHQLFSETTDGEKEEMNDAVANLLRRGRHTKIHMVLATQEATRGNLQFRGRNNVTARIAFACSDIYESQAIIQAPGAEKLMGQGALKFKSPNNGIRLTDMQGSYLPDDMIMEFLRTIPFEQRNKHKFIMPEVGSDRASAGANSARKPTSGDEALLAKIIIELLGMDSFSSLFMEKKFRIGFRRAAPIMDILVELGIITEKHVNRPREVIPVRIEEIPAEVKKLLNGHGYSEADIAAALTQRPGNAGLEHEGTP